LPVFGFKRENQKIAFEWPEEEIFYKMKSNVGIASMTFKGSPSSISSVQVTLTNGKKSDVLQKNVLDHQLEQTINFLDSAAVRSIRASECTDEDAAWIGNISFLDGAGQVLAEYTPFEEGGVTRTLRLEEGQELIGVYGFHRTGRSKAIRGLGFIVKVRLSQ